MIYTPQQSISQSSEIQLKARNTEKGTHLAYFFIKGKAKNQIHLIKYFNKYLKKSETENAKNVEQHIQKMISLYESLTQSNKKATADESTPLFANMDHDTIRNHLMGKEGIISQHSSPLVS